MKSWTLIASYLLKDTWSRWLEQPSSVLSRMFVGGLLVTVATVILVAFNLLERNPLWRQFRRRWSVVCLAKDLIL